MLGAQIAVALVRWLLAALHQAALAAAMCPTQPVGHGDLGAVGVLAAGASSVGPADPARLGALGAALDCAARVAAVLPAQTSVLSAAIALINGTAFATL